MTDFFEKNFGLESYFEKCYQKMINFCLKLCAHPMQLTPTTPSDPANLYSHEKFPLLLQGRSVIYSSPMDCRVERAEEEPNFSRSISSESEK